MRIRFLVLMLIIAPFAALAAPQQALEPLSKNEVISLLKAEMDVPELIKLIHEHGVDFDLSEDFLQTLTKAGATEPVIQALRAARIRPLTQSQILELVAGHVPSERAAALVKLHGIDFVPGEEYVKTVRLAGGDDMLIAALREAGKAVRHTGSVREDPKDGLNYVWIPPGTFMMGCSPGDNDCNDIDEKPAHQVTISQGFWMGQTDVTVGAYQRWVVATGRQMPAAPKFNPDWVKQNMPVVNVTWDDAHAYCGWVRGRLPTEAEWEYAARGGSTEVRYGPIDEIAWYGGNSGNQTHDVAQKRANAFGLYDVLGNVREWVNDWYDENYFQTGPTVDPHGPANGKGRIQRGGSWVGQPKYIRVSARPWYSPASKYDYIGFRCAQDGGSPVAP